MHNEVYDAMVQCKVVPKEHHPDYKTDDGNIAIDLKKCLVFLA